MNDKHIEQLASAIRSISHGGSSGPEGLEMLSMAIAGEGIRGDLCSSLDGIAASLSEIAEAIRESGNGH